ncbi:MAG TPA: hypothetical protein VJ160_01935 [Anaerolineales bacterium]|nr:hypothetical protein [Anaerolineales bacterium]
MRILPDLPDLHILPSETLRPHEHHDDRRALPLAEALRRDGVLRNPPVVLRLSGHAERYVVLDGANRTTAFRQLGMEHVLAQVVHPGDNQVSVETWNHALLNVGEDELLGLMHGVEGIDLIDSNAEPASADLASLSLSGGRELTIASSNFNLRQRVLGLNQLVQAYHSKARIERTNARALDEMLAAFPSAAGLIVFRGFEVQDIVDAVSEELLLPGGLTRFIVSPRALRVNYPLTALMAPVSRESKEQTLAEWVRQKVAGRQVRFYAEATYLFDE